jgi:hypothetical protein
MLTPDEATAALDEARRVSAMGWRLVSGQATRLPLIWWGVAWLVTYPAVQFLPFVPALVVAGAGVVAASVMTRVGARWDPAPGTTGWEREVDRAWWALLVAGFAFNLIAGPAAIAVYFLLPGAVWGLALLLYALVAGDVGLGVLGAGILVLAAALRIVAPDRALVIFGVLAGGGMAAVGAVRLLTTARQR